MKIVFVALLLVSCAFAVDWTTYSCNAMGSFTPTSFTCAQWNTFPIASVPCLNAQTSCGLLAQCAGNLSSVLSGALSNACSTQIGSSQKSTTGLLVRP